MKPGGASKLAVVDHPDACSLRWADSPNDKQYGLYDSGVRNDFSAAQKAFEKICPVSGTLAIAWLGEGVGVGVGIGIGFAFDLT